jgi:hypothetical protein
MREHKKTKFFNFGNNLSIVTRQAIIERTLKAINQLPNDKAQEVSDFAEFIMKQHEEQQLSKGVQQLAAQSQTFDFLNNEEDLYTEEDLKEKYNA